MKNLFLGLMLMMLFSCEQSQPQQVQLPQDNGLASVDKVNGLYVFVNSKPVRDYDQLGKLNLNVLAEGVEQKEGIGEIIKGIAGNLGFQDKLNNMIQRVSSDTTYQNADGVIFEGKMDQCTVIKFKN